MLMKKDEKRMESKKFMHILGYIMLGSWLLHFLVYAVIDEHPIVYKTKDIVEGILFILVVTPIYFAIVNLYYKGKRKIVFTVLTSLGITSVIFIFIDYY